MSMRPRVGQTDIERFLVEVGRLRRPGRLYLVGGAALVHSGIRLGQTLDIDIQITLDLANLIDEVSRLKQRLNMYEYRIRFSRGFYAASCSMGDTVTICSAL